MTRESIQVAVRIRPPNTREKQLSKTEGVSICCWVQDKTTILVKDKTGEKDFHFNYCFDQKTSQREIYGYLGKPILKNIFDGFNSCIIAYGQTGAGKTYSITGQGEDERGILPRICEGLFEMKQTHTVSISYVEIYQEKLKDLLYAKTNPPTLTLFEIPGAGVSIKNAIKDVVQKYLEIEEALAFGNMKRTTGSTQMNQTSSRSHAVFQIFVDTNSNSSVLNVVDLAGSEIQKKTGAVGQTQKEGAAINSSLSKLGIIIQHLSSGKPGHVPYRDSRLTYLLKDSISGKSKTVMMAAISPALDNYAETMSTIRFAQNCTKIEVVATKQIKTAATVEDLKKEIKMLRKKLEDGANRDFDESAIEEYIARETRPIDERREESIVNMALRKNGLIRDGQTIRSCETYPILVSMNFTGSQAGLVYTLTPGDNLVGSNKKCNIIVFGSTMQEKMCTIRNVDNKNLTIRLHKSKNLGEAQTPVVRVNTVSLKSGSEIVKLQNNDVIEFGETVVTAKETSVAVKFRVHIPQNLEANKNIVEISILENVIQEVSQKDPAAAKLVREVLAKHRNEVDRCAGVNLVATTKKLLQEALTEIRSYPVDDPYIRSVKIQSDTMDTQGPRVIIQFILHEAAQKEYLNTSYVPRNSRFSESFMTSFNESMENSGFYSSTVQSSPVLHKSLIQLRMNGVSLSNNSNNSKNSRKSENSKNSRKSENSKSSKSSGKSKKSKNLEKTKKPKNSGKSRNSKSSRKSKNSKSLKNMKNVKHMQTRKPPAKKTGKLATKNVKTMPK